MSIITSIIFLFVLMSILGVLDGKSQCVVRTKVQIRKPISLRNRNRNKNKSTNKKAKFPEDWDI